MGNVVKARNFGFFVRSCPVVGKFNEEIGFVVIFCFRSFTSVNNTVHTLISATDNLLRERFELQFVEDGAEGCHVRSRQSHGVE